MTELKPFRRGASSTRLAVPLRRFLLGGVDERVMRRMWENIDGRTAPRGPERTHRHWPRLVLAWGALLLVGAGFWALELRPGSATRSGELARALLTREGERFESLEAAPDGDARSVVLADGSLIEALPGARIEGLAATPSDFIVLVRRGKARFSVTPGGPRRWSIETRAARVEVVGTRLSVEVAEGALRIQVDEGAVLVRSPQLPDGVQRLDAGHSLLLESSPPAGTGAQPVVAPVVPLERPTAEARSSLHEPDTSAAAGALPPSSRQQQLGQRPLDAGRTPPSGTASSATVGARGLWAEADRARASGDPARAAELLERIIREYPRDSETPLAAFTLGTLYQEKLAQPLLAARAFRSAIELGVPSALMDSAYQQVAKVFMSQGNPTAVAGMIEEYTRKYPNGTARPALERLREKAAARARRAQAR